MSEIFLALCNEVPLGGSHLVILEDGREVALFAVDGEFYALNNSCPHMGGPLAEGPFEGHIVTCPWHGWEFDVRDGHCLNMPGDDALTLPIKVVDGSIFLLE